MAQVLLRLLLLLNGLLRRSFSVWNVLHKAKASANNNNNLQCEVAAAAASANPFVVV